MTSPRQFRIIRTLGKGGFGEVYLADMFREGGLSQRVAIKVLLPDLDPKGQAVQRLRDEAKMLAALDHPTILRVYDLTTLDGRVALVAEYVPGLDLDEAAQAGCPVRGLINLVGQVAEALSAALEEGIIHRDIKPANIRCSKYGYAKLLDFGIASLDGSSDLVREAKTATGLVVASPGYVSPERFDGEVGPAADVFGLGITLWEVVRRKRVFAGQNMRQVLRVLMDPDRYATLLDTLVSELHDPETTLDKRHADLLGELLRGMMALDPVDRWVSCEIADVCDTIAASMGPSNYRSARDWARKRLWATATKEDAPGLWEGRTLTEGSRIRTGFGLGAPTANTEIYGSDQSYSQS